MNCCDIARRKSSILAIDRVVVALSMSASTCVHAQVGLFGGPTFDTTVGTGFQNGEINVLPPGRAVNDTGVAVGFAGKFVSTADLGPRGVRWDTLGNSLELQILETSPSGFSESKAFAINSSSLSAGYAIQFDGGTPVGFKAVRWNSSGNAQALMNLDVNSSSVVYALNDANWAAGFSQQLAGSSYLGDRAVRWDDAGAILELDNLGTDGAGYTFSQAFAINASNSVAGYAFKFEGGIEKGFRGVRWNLDGTAVELDHLGLDAMGATSSEARFINSSNVTAGYATKFVNNVAMGTRAVRWTPTGTVLELGDIGTDANSFATGLNDSNVVVGHAAKLNGPAYIGDRAVRWDALGNAQELGTLGTAASGDTFSQAFAINDANVAVGYSRKYISGSSVGLRAVYWTRSGAAIDLTELLPSGSGWLLNESRAISDGGYVSGFGQFDPPGEPESFQRLFTLDVRGHFVNDSGVDDGFSTPSNWAAGAVPTAATDASFASPIGYTVSLSESSVVRDLQIAGGTVSLNLAGQLLSLNRNFEVGVVGAGPGRLILNGGGTVAVAGTALVGANLNEAGEVLIGSGIHVTSGTLLIGQNQGNGVVEIGAGATWIADGPVNLGAGGGAGRLKINLGAAFTSLGSLAVSNNLSSIALDGGSLSADSLSIGGIQSRFQWTAGTLEINNSNVAVQAGGLFGSAVALSTGQHLRVTDRPGGATSGTLTIAAGGALAVTGGGSVFADVLDAPAGQLLITSSAQGTAGFLTVGRTGSASLTIADGATLTSGRTTVAAQAAAQPSIVVVSNARAEFGSTLTIGSNGGIGLVTINQFATGSAGVIAIAPANTLHVNGGTLIVGSFSGNGNLQFQSGTIAFTNSVNIGATPYFTGNFTTDNAHNLVAVGTMTVSSPRTLTIAGGFVSAGTLAINAGAQLLLDSSSAQLLVDNLTVNSGLIRGNGQIDGAVFNQSNGEIRSSAGESIRIIGSGTNNGLINLLGGELDLISANLHNNPAGRVSGRGSLRAGKVTNAGTLLFSGGVTTIESDVNNLAGGRIIVNGSGTVQLNGSLSMEAGATLSVSSTSEMNVLGNVSSDGRFIAGGGGGGTLNFTGLAAQIESAAGTVEVSSDGTFATGNGITASIGTIALDGRWNVATGTVSVARVAGAGAIAHSAGAHTSTTKFDVGAINITGGTLAVQAGGGTTGTSRIANGTISVSGAGRLDLNDHSLAVDYSTTTPLDVVRDELTTGYANGSWNGAGGIVSTVAATNPLLNTALGYAEASDLSITILDGVAVDATTVVVRYTLYGDANLDRIVDIGDFSILAANFGQGPGPLPEQVARDWDKGDFNFDRMVNIEDFARLGANFNQMLSSSDLPRGPLPEPACGVAGAALWLLARRRARQVESPESIFKSAKSC